MRVRNKFVDRMYEKSPETNNIDNKRPLQQIFNKREFNYLNKYNNEIDRVKEMLNSYKTLKADSDNARWKHNDIIKKLNEQEEFEIYKLKKDAKIQKQKRTNKKKKEDKKQKPANLHRFAYNVILYTDATETDTIEIESGIWKQKHKAKYLVRTLEGIKHYYIQRIRPCYFTITLNYNGNVIYTLKFTDVKKEVNQKYFLEFNNTRTYDCDVF